MGERVGGWSEGGLGRVGLNDVDFLLLVLHQLLETG
jgi:hypothetical protein